MRAIFLFQYIHEQETRRRDNYQLTKLGNRKQLAAELNLDKTGLIQYATREDRLVIARSKQLLINAITCWSLLHISQKLQESSHVERAQLLASLPDTAPLSWRHINFQPGRWSGRV